jgi:hypothetical protein
VIATIDTSENADRQAACPRYCPPGTDPLRDAVVANASLKLHLRRFRRDLVGPRQLATTNRLLDASDAIGRALSWLGATGAPCATSVADDELAELGQLDPLAMDAAAKPEAVGVSQ